MIYAIFSDYLTFLQLVMIVKLWLVLTWMFFQAVTCKLCVIKLYPAVHLLLEAGMIILVHSRIASVHL